VRGDGDAVVLLRAAGASVVHRTPAAAALWFRAALRLLPESPAHDDERRALFTELASALRGSGDLGACREALRDALDLTAPDDLPARTALEARCATVESWLGRADEAHRRLRRARAAVRDDQSREAVTLDVRLALEALNGLEFDEGVATASRALASARKLDDHALLCEAAAALSLACALAGSMKDARDHRATAVRALESLPEAAQADRLEIFFYLAWAENNLEELELGIATAERGMALSRATGQGHLLVPLMLARLLPLDRLGRLAEAIAAGEEAIEAARTSPNPQYLYWALWECAYSHAIAGDFDRAMPLFEESVEASRGLASNFLCWAQPGSAYGYALAQAGDPERGYRVQLEALGGPEIPRIAPYERVLTHADLTEALVALDRLDDAAGQADRAEALAEQLGQVGVRALAAQARATLLLAQGDPAAAVRVAAAAREPATAAGLRLDGAFLQRLEGIGLARTGQREAAVAALRECERDLDSFPARRARDDVRRELRKLGARVEARKGGTDGASGLGALSAREREVVELVADRHMNKQIAAALFLSEKTVESHLRSVFRKLGVSSRVDVARAVERERAER
jgi:ATP/maltotriose-dependent transcriptional regulator MalT